MKLLKKIFLLTAVLIPLLFFTLNQRYQEPAEAYETSCPSSMSDEECLEFLNQQSALINQEKKEIESSLESEQSEQQSLGQQISYIASAIQKTELEISELRVEISRNNAQLNILGTEIQKIEVNIDTLTQEINILTENINKRTKIGYKLSLISPIELLFGSNDIETTLRKMKYIVETKAKDEEMLHNVSISKDMLKAEETALIEKRAEVQEARNEIEEDKNALEVKSSTLSVQKSEQQALLAESEQREQEYQYILSQLKSQQAAVEEQVTDLIMKLFQSGQLGEGTPVTKGEIVGFQGHTGCSLGSHLHFEIRTNGIQVNPFSSYLTGGSLYNPVGSGSMYRPLDGGYLTQTYWSGHRAIDAVSYTHGVQPQDYYYKEKGEVNCPSWFNINAYLPAWLPLRGEGAPVRAIAGGTVYRSTADAYGGKYVLIDHGNGLTSLYLHLR